MISRLGVYGGMFDPVHKGHISAACYARDLLKLEELRLVPCKHPNHRDETQASAGDRLAMLELAMSNCPGLEVDTCELDRPGISFAVETLEYLREKLGPDQLVFVLGIDAFNTLSSWHRWESLMGLCHLLVLPRKHGRLNDELGDALQLSSREVREPEQLFQASAGNVYLDASFDHHASSSEVRHALKEGENVETLLHGDVFDYIVAHKLYGVRSANTLGSNFAHGQ